MTRHIATLMLDTARPPPFRRMIDSLGEALSTTQFEGGIDLERGEDGIEFEGRLIVSIRIGAIRDFTLPVIASPTIHLPQFAAEVCRRAPGVRVWWIAGWPHFSARGSDVIEDPGQPPSLPLEIEPCL